MSSMTVHLQQISGETIWPATTTASSHYCCWLQLECSAFLQTWACQGQDRAGQRKEVVSHLSEGDVMLLADIQSSSGLVGLNKQVSRLLLLPMLQEEVSCISDLKLAGNVR